MSGLVLDIFLEYIFRSAWIFIRRNFASGWPVLDATVIESNKRDSGLGCTVTVILYKYRNESIRFEGIHKEPFWFNNYAAAYLNRYPGGSVFPVRMNPRKPSESIQAETPTFQAQ